VTQRVGLPNAGTAATLSGMKRLPPAMKRLPPALAVLLLLAMPAAAQDFGKGLEAYQRGDYAAALREWRPLAGQGDAAAQYKLGALYDDGQGVPQDHAEAARWYRKAAEQGHAWAQYKLGALYDDGQGVPQDHAEAMRWYRKAAKQGYAIVAYTIGDYQGAARLYRELAEQGDVEAQDRLGSMYNRGMGVPEDYAEAAKWYRKAAEQGYASAQYNLGNMYLSGDGVPQDYVQAYKWFILMLSQNDPPCGVQTASDQDQEQQDAMDYLCEQVRSLEAANRQQVREILRLLRSKKMTPAQIAEAQKLAREWLAEHGK
jgi:hypothetical protein